MTNGRRRDRDGAAAPAPQRLGRVLLPEDEQDVAELIRYNLSREGYDVVETANGAEALRLSREQHPDVILLDIMVPQLNGWEGSGASSSPPRPRNPGSRRSGAWGTGSGNPNRNGFVTWQKPERNIGGR